MVRTRTPEAVGLRLLGLLGVADEQDAVVFAEDGEAAAVGGDGQGAEAFGAGGDVEQDAVGADAEQLQPPASSIVTSVRSSGVKATSVGQARCPVMSRGGRPGCQSRMVRSPLTEASRPSGL